MKFRITLPYCALQFGSTFAPIWPHREHTTPSPSNPIGVPSGKWPTLTIALRLQPLDWQYARARGNPAIACFPEKRNRIFRNPEEACFEFALLPLREQPRRVTVARDRASFCLGHSASAGAVRRTFAPG